MNQITVTKLLHGAGWQCPCGYGATDLAFMRQHLSAGHPTSLAMFVDEVDPGSELGALGDDLLACLEAVRDEAREDGRLAGFAEAMNEVRQLRASTPAKEVYEVLRGAALKEDDR